MTRFNLDLVTRLLLKHFWEEIDKVYNTDGPDDLKDQPYFDLEAYQNDLIGWVMDDLWASPLKDHHFDVRLLDEAREIKGHGELSTTWEEAEAFQEYCRSVEVTK